MVLVFHVTQVDRKIRIVVTMLAMVQRSKNTYMYYLVPTKGNRDTYRGKRKLARAE